MQINFTHSTTGRDFLEHRSRVAKAIQQLPPIKDVLVVEDKQSDADRIASTINMVLGHTTTVRFARNELAIQPELRAAMPDLLMLDDRLSIARQVKADKTVPAIRRYGYTGKIILVSEIVTRERWVELQRLTISFILHKDDLTSTGLSEAILAAHGIKFHK